MDRCRPPRQDKLAFAFMWLPNTTMFLVACIGLKSVSPIQVGNLAMNPPLAKREMTLTTFGTVKPADRLLPSRKMRALSRFLLSGKEPVLCMHWAAQLFLQTTG